MGIGISYLSVSIRRRLGMTAIATGDQSLPERTIDRGEWKREENSTKVVREVASITRKEKNCGEQE